MKKLTPDKQWKAQQRQLEQRHISRAQRAVGIVLIVLGVLCAVWRTLARKYKNYLTSEARGLMAVYRQKEGGA